MPSIRKFIAVLILLAISLGLTAFWNNFAGIIYDFAANLYFTGLATLCCTLLFHQRIVRQIWRRDRLYSFCIGLAITGVCSMVLYDGFRDITAHITWLQREGTTINWGDDGMQSGLPRSAYGLSDSDFWSKLPRTLISAVIYGFVWFPVLAMLERWAYAQPQVRSGDLDH